jgi:hypothetical protein
MKNLDIAVLNLLLNKQQRWLDSTTLPRDKMPLMELTGKQSMFLDIYTADHFRNATKAAREAGYRCPRQAAAELLSKPVIKDAIRQHLRDAGINRRAVLMRLAQFAFADPSEVVPVKTKGRTYLLKRLRIKGGVTLELHDPIKALELIGKALGMWDLHDRQLRRQEVDLLRQRLGVGNTLDFADMVQGAERAAQSRLAERNGDGQLGTDDEHEGEN